MIPSISRFRANRAGPHSGSSKGSLDGPAHIVPVSSPVASCGRPAPAPDAPRHSAWQVSIGLDDDTRQRLNAVLRDRDAAIRLTRARCNAWRRARGLPALPALHHMVFADRLPVLVILTLETGLRWRECRRLRWSDIDLTHRHLVVRTAHAKTHQTRHIPLTTVALAILGAWRKQTPGEWLFPSDTGTGPVSTVRTAWRHIVRQAGLPDFHWCDLRHDFARRAAASGVRRLLNDSTRTLADRYAHGSPAGNASHVALLDAHSATSETEAVTSRDATIGHSKP